MGRANRRAWTMKIAPPDPIVTWLIATVLEDAGDAPADDALPGLLDRAYDRMPQALKAADWRLGLRAETLPAPLPGIVNDVKGIALRHIRVGRLAGKTLTQIVAARTKLSEVFR